MKHKYAFLLALSASVGLAGCDIDPADWGDSNRYKEDFSYTYKLDPGGRLFLESFNGSVEILGWDKDSVEVTGTKYAARKENMENLKIDAVSEPNYLRLRAIRPVERNCNCGAKFVLRVPKKITIDRIETSNGSIRAEGTSGPARLKTSNGSMRLWGMTGDVEATTSNGSIEVTEFSGAAILKTSNARIRAEGIRGNFAAETSNGSIDVNIEELDAGRSLKLDTSNSTISLNMAKYNSNPVIADTSNGSINVRLPAAVNAEVRASTSNGSITSDFELTTRTISKTKLDGRLGNGGPLLDLSTSNGSIRLLKR
ncbi:MAG TPA: DUF4097 family beta strand repeat-containing protein [Bryobacteraceae bacterium]|nr:DUF4097 family beta strand repeat-containing protein [Bryobacteraceae bacterium]